MPLNESKGNMYEFVTHTWNAIKGACPHDCSYCYMKKWGKLKPVHLDEKEFKTDLGSGNFIFVGSSCDMFADAIPKKWIIPVLNHCWNFEGNKYLFQTKNPNRVIEFMRDMPKELVNCTTIETNRWYEDIMMNSPTPLERADAMKHLNIYGIETYVTIEPIMDFGLEGMVKLIHMCQPKQVNIGADTGRNNLPEPSKEKILELISGLEEFTIVHQKSNLKRLLK